jgi:hypothetical protein
MQEMKGKINRIKHDWKNKLRRERKKELMEWNEKRDKQGTKDSNEGLCKRKKEKKNRIKHD